jgi:hypothetical protein
MPLFHVVLAVAFVFESISWYLGWKVFRKVKGQTGALDAIRRSKDPTTFIVVFEDTGALAGLVIAFMGDFAGHVFHNHYFDAGASLVIGIMLALMAFFSLMKLRGC